MNRVYVDFRVIGQATEVAEFYRLLQYIQACGAGGSSRTIPLDVDGDGSGCLRFQLLNEPDSDPVKDVEINPSIAEEVRSGQPLRGVEIGE